MKVTHKRNNLIMARKAAGLTQAQMAKRLYLSKSQYQFIEYCLSDGKLDMWDRLEDIFDIHQRKLRERFETRKGAAK